MFDVLNNLGFHVFVFLVAITLIIGGIKLIPREKLKQLRCKILRYHVPIIGLESDKRRMWYCAVCNKDLHQDSKGRFV